MPSIVRVMRADLARLHRRALASQSYESYRGDPCKYARDVLKIELWHKQEEILDAVLRYPYRVLAKSSHNVGKTFTAAVLVSYWFDCHVPSVVLTTAPTVRDVRQLLWAEIRIQRRKAGLTGVVGVEMPYMRRGPDHYAYGFTAAVGESFQGRHPGSLLIIMDEAVGVAQSYWTTAPTMAKPEPGYGILCTFNPTDPTSAAYQADQARDGHGQPTWNSVTMSALEHPNIAIKENWFNPRYPSAVTYPQLDIAVQDECEVVYQGARA